MNLTRLNGKRDGRQKIFMNTWFDLVIDRLEPYEVELKLYEEKPEWQTIRVFGWVLISMVEQ